MILAKARHCKGPGQSWSGELAEQGDQQPGEGGKRGKINSYQRFIYCPLNLVVYSGYWYQLASDCICRQHCYSVACSSLHLWVHQHEMISHLSCSPFWWPTLPTCTSL